jgi:hypothetical protein
MIAVPAFSRYPSICEMMSSLREATMAAKSYICGRDVNIGDGNRCTDIPAARR